MAIESAIQRKLAKRVEDHDALDPSREEKILHHVKNEERLHSVIGKAFPGFGEGEEPEPARVPEEIGLVFFPAERDGIVRFGGRGHGQILKARVTCDK